VTSVPPEFRRIELFIAGTIPTRAMIDSVEPVYDQYGNLTGEESNLRRRRVRLRCRAHGREWRTREQLIAPSGHSRREECECCGLSDLRYACDIELPG
jgi:hypothetical protein